ncbi:hypothetical protein VF14_23080 [Nostoc linckia z18]|jgi:uncharacterized protein YxjI|uniref:Uncharacterized protein n=3 Tax=Nostoc TaxID=1177 RepID=A0A9Q6EIA1_NOSLI|nr:MULTISPECIES: hypothetical protein [Nostoc]MDZ8013115.1 hypothetical protein [Nostoc sp. ZfuVER08]PHK36134.1 hypothetical protein VF12_21650 [Nostoc linckia z15]PHK42102.1 hypothetical protein VF13_30225 [Nostoc linckia z16]MBC1238468.1 hypothetical protein [Nostoc sp. 2RC]MBD2611074.1 hypothetical protein [Nostoc punctiforme FACHB-252]
MQYPLELTFKLWALAPQISVVDAQNNLIFYVKQKLFKLKEAITIFADGEQTRPLYYIKADRIIDFSARYDFTDSNGSYIGSVKRRGLKSIWRARYDIFDGETTTLNIQEKNPWVKVADALFAEIPILGLFTGYVFNPVYLVSRDDGTIVMRLEKIPTFLSRKFIIKAVDQLSDRQEQQILLSLLMMLLLERNRG